MLTPRIERYVRRHFDDAELVLAALDDWKISYEEEPPGERLTAALVLAADGSLEGIDAAFELAEQDWRDLLVAGGLAHEDWPELLDLRSGGRRLARMTPIPGEPLEPQRPELTTSDGRKVKLKLPGLKPPVKPHASEQRGSTEPPRDDPRLPLDPNFIGPP